MDPSISNSNIVYQTINQIKENPIQWILNHKIGVGITIFIIISIISLIVVFSIYDLDEIKNSFKIKKSEFKPNNDNEIDESNLNIDKNEDVSMINTKIANDINAIPLTEGRKPE